MWIGYSLILDCRDHGIVKIYTPNNAQLCILIKQRQTVKISSISLEECNGKLMEGLKTLKTCGEILISHTK